MCVAGSGTVALGRRESRVVGTPGATWCLLKQWGLMLLQGMVRPMGWRALSPPSQFHPLPYHHRPKAVPL